MAVVSTRHAGIPEAIEHGVSGLLVEERDVEGMAEAMGRIANDAALCARLGAAVTRRPRNSTRGQPSGHACSRHLDVLAEIVSGKMVGLVAWDGSN